jgi:hypothetical protein
MRTNPRYCNNFVDSNALDQAGGPEDAAMAEVLALAASGEFTLLLPYSVQAEIERTNTPAAVQQRAARLNYSLPVQLTAQEREVYVTLRALLQGKAQPGKQDKDAFHLVESQKNGGRYFITNDRRLLNKGAAIWRALTIETIKPSDFLVAYRAYAKGGS